MKKVLKETFKIDPRQGAIAALISLQKPGYKIVRIERKNTEAVVTFKEN